MMIHSLKFVCMSYCLLTELSIWPNSWYIVMVLTARNDSCKLRCFDGSSEGTGTLTVKQLNIFRFAYCKHQNKLVRVIFLFCVFGNIRSVKSLWDKGVHMSGKNKIFSRSVNFDHLTGVRELSGNFVITIYFSPKMIWFPLAKNF